MQLGLPQEVEMKGLRVLTTRQLAECYDSDSETLKNNFTYNRKRFIEGKHYIKLTGAELKEFKARYEIHTNLKFAKILYLWTEKGALLHAKSLNTDKAWEAYDYLIDFYFHAKEETKPDIRQQDTDCKKLVVDVPENAAVQEAMKKVQDRITTIKVLTEKLNEYQCEESYDKLSDMIGTMWLDLGQSITGLINTPPNIIKRKF